jgi:hypothetical protein
LAVWQKRLASLGGRLGARLKSGRQRSASDRMRYVGQRQHGPLKKEKYKTNSVS